MTITITTPGPTGSVGLGLPITLQSDFIGPLPTGTLWRVSIYLGSSTGSNLVWTEGFPTPTVGPSTYYLGIKFISATQAPLQFPTEGTSVNIDVTLGVLAPVDTGSASAPYSSLLGMAWAEWIRFNTLATLQQPNGSIDQILHAVKPTYSNA